MSGPGHAEGAQGEGAQCGRVAESVHQPAAVLGVVASASRLAVELRLVLEATGASRCRSNCAALCRSAQSMGLEGTWSRHGICSS